MNESRVNGYKRELRAAITLGDQHRVDEILATLEAMGVKRDAPTKTGMRTATAKQPVEKRG